MTLLMSKSSLSGQDVERAVGCMVAPIKSILGVTTDVGVIGGFGGGLMAGAKTGAFVGSYGGPVGTAVGGIIGALLGADVGAGASSALGNLMRATLQKIEDMLTEFLKWLLITDDQFCRALETLELDCAEELTCSEAKGAYKALARFQHPDKVPRSATAEAKAEAQANFQKLAAAWEVALQHFGGRDQCSHDRREL